MGKAKLQSWYKRINKIDLLITNKLCGPEHIDCHTDCPFYNAEPPAKCEALELTNVIKEILRELRNQ